MRIALCGTSSVGKTSLLERIVHPNKIQEVARKLIKEYGNLPHEMQEADRVNFQNELFALQCIEEEKYDNFISDRSLIDILAYSQDVQEIRTSVLATLIGRYDLILYLPIEFPMEADGIRKEDEEYRKLIDKRIQKLLQKLDIMDSNLKMWKLAGSIEDRIIQYNHYVNANS